MQIVIDIPEVFEEHFKHDRFKDSLERISEDSKRSAIVSGRYEFETIEMLIKAFENSKTLIEWLEEMAEKIKRGEVRHFEGSD